MRTTIGVMGGGVASQRTMDHAFELGRLIAEKEWVLLNGGRDEGVMAASAKGASEAGGLVVGILPGDTTAGASPHLDIAVPTGMGDGRNIVNVLASRIVVALPGGAGTISEVALALKSGRHVVTVAFPLGSPFAPYYQRGQLVDVETPGAAVAEIERLLAEGRP